MKPLVSTPRGPAAPDAEELALMRWIDEQYLATPFYSSRRMTAGLRQAGHQVNRKRVQQTHSYGPVSRVHRSRRRG